MTDDKSKTKTTKSQRTVQNELQSRKSPDLSAQKNYRDQVKE